METDQVITVHRPIKGFFDEYRFLSNYYESPVEYEGLIYKSSEAAYQAAKVIGNEARKPFTVVGPGTSKKMGKTVKLRPDWDQVKEQIMLEICQMKFKNPELKQMLLSTADAHLEETNYWGDRYWGVVDGEGLNKLGFILMKIREESKEL